MALCTFDHRGDLLITVNDIPRCPSPQARSNYVRNRTGSMKFIMAWTATEDENDYNPVPRVKTESLGNYELNKGGRMKRNVGIQNNSYQTERHVLYGQVWMDSKGEMRSRISVSDMIAPFEIPRREVICGCFTLTGSYFYAHIPLVQFSITGLERLTLTDYGNAILSARGTRELRVKPEAELNAALDRGKRMEALLTSYNQPLTTRSTYRSNGENSDEAILNNSVNMDHLISCYGLTTHTTNQKTKMKPDMERYANLTKEDRMKRLTKDSKKLIKSPLPVPRVKPEAHSNYTLDMGKRIDNLIHKHGMLTPSPRMPARVKPEAEPNAELDKGKRMANLIHKHGILTPSPRMPARVKPEAEPNAELDKGKRMERLINEYLQHPPSARQVPRIKPEAEAIAHYGKNGLAHILMNYYGRIKPSPRPVPRVKREAKNTAHRAKGSMKKHFTDMGQKQCIYVPGKQKKMFERTVTV